MEHNSVQASCPYCIRLGTLIQHFARMSSGADQWVARPVSGLFVSPEGEVRRFVLAGYSNAQPTELPNPLVFALPLTIQRRRQEAEPALIVCFDPKSIVPLCGGLYWEEDDLQYDPLEDWDRFWSPIRKWVSESAAAAERSDCDEVRDVRSTDRQRRTLEGISYKDSLCAYVTWWSQNKEKIQDAVCQ
jgi:hypothetical protein